MPMHVLKTLKSETNFLQFYLLKIKHKIGCSSFTKKTQYMLYIIIFFVLETNLWKPGIFWNNTRTISPNLIAKLSLIGPKTFLLFLALSHGSESWNTNGILRSWLPMVWLQLFTPGFCGKHRRQYKRRRVMHWNRKTLY